MIVYVCTRLARRRWLFRTTAAKMRWLDRKLQTHALLRFSLIVQMRCSHRPEIEIPTLRERTTPTAISCNCQLDTPLYICCAYVLLCSARKARVKHTQHRLAVEVGGRRGTWALCYKAGSQGASSNYCCTYLKLTFSLFFVGTAAAHAEVQLQHGMAAFSFRLCR